MTLPENNGYEFRLWMRPPGEEEEGYGFTPWRTTHNGHGAFGPYSHIVMEWDENIGRNGEGTFILEVRKAKSRAIAHDLYGQS